MQKRNVLSSPRLNEFKKKKRAVIRNRILIVFVLVVVVVTGVSTFASWKKINISTIGVTGNKVIDTADIQKIVTDDMTGKYLWIFPKTNFLFYPKSYIKNDLAKNFTRLENISVNLKNPNTLDITVGEREPTFTWCGLTPNTPGQKCYFMDASGYIFDEAPFFSGSVYFKFFGNISTPDTPNGNYFSGSTLDTFAKLIALKTNIESLGLKPIGLYIVGDGDIQIFLPGQNQNSSGPQILLTEDANFNQVVENLQTALTTEPFQTDFKKKYSSLLYIDLRFGDKVYYKFNE